MLVQQILNAKPEIGIVSVKPGDRISDAAKLLSEKRIGTVVVLEDDGTMAGILSERDIVRELGKAGAECLAQDVSSLMTAKLITCTKKDKADDVLTQMTDGRFRHMPVMEDGKLVGLISIGDVVKARLSELSMEKDALEGMIRGH